MAVNKKKTKKKNNRNSKKIVKKNSSYKKKVVKNNNSKNINKKKKNALNNSVNKKNKKSKIKKNISNKNISNIVEKVSNISTNTNTNIVDSVNDNIIQEKELKISDSVSLENDKINEDFLLDNDKEKNNIKYKCVGLLFLFLVVFGFFFVLSFNMIKLEGERELVISYKDTYQELGYVFNFFNEDLSNEVVVDNNVVNGVVGNYQVNYYVDKFGIKFKRVRNVMVVDNDSPEITVENEVINICPNSEIPEFKYEALDEYDGDITSKVIRTVLDDEVLLSVKDSSNNESSLSVKIDRVDSIEPVIKLKGNAIMYLEYGSKYVEPGYEVSDNCDNDLIDKVVVSGTVGRNIGTYNIRYEVVDDSGNKSSVSRKVIVGTKINDNGMINNGSIYLTFDDGPNVGTTNKILDILKEEGVKATFFVTSNGSDELIKRMYDEGHTVALHTALHDYSYIYSSVDNYFADLKRVSDRVKRITGIESKIIRFPGGSSNMVSRNYKIGIMTELTNLVLNQGYRYFDWNVDAMDASSARTSSEVYYNVISNLSMDKVNVVLMHDTKSITVGALRNIIRFGKEYGYQFREIDMNTRMVRHGVNN